MRMIFVNLPVKDLALSKSFWSALGFSFNDIYSDDTCACLVIEENVFVMLLVESRFRDFITGDISDAHAATEVLTCLSAQDRQEVDSTVARALASGGKPWKPVFEAGPMYAGSFQDPDGHVWELLSMEADDHR